MRRLLRDHGLSIVMFGLFFVFVCGQSVMGLLDYNSTQHEHGRQPVGYVQYLGSGDFIEAVFENWESEFLQMGLYVVLTAFLYQRGSAESRDPDSQHPDEAGYDEAKHRADAPWPVRKGALALKLYENSLSTVLEAAPIGGQLFAHGISGRDCIAFCLLLDTYDTRLLAQALIYRTSAKGVFS